MRKNNLDLRQRHPARRKQSPLKRPQSRDDNRRNHQIGADHKRHDRRQDRPVKVSSNAAAKNSQGTPTQIAQYSVHQGQVSAPKVPNGPEIPITAVVTP